MQFKNLLIAFVLTIGAAANNASDIAPTVQRRISQLDLGFKQTDVLLSQLTHNTGDATANDIVVAYKEVVAREATDMMMPQPWKPLEDSQQMVICQSFHSLALTGIELNYNFVNSVNYFNQTQRHDLQHCLNKVTEETGDFVKGVAKTATPYCLDIIQDDNKAIYKSIHDARQALAAL
ncbi:hypothetical protein N7532_005702 [Penicillium argentinense]|uniref:Uncharacterized protein n=1 Tax=Penicillium argentinense TaxID=1131581 RepID=A0A9W9KAM6_9EURO|nr:uncharacterized protein N7532_005702 [Penicillium argentinense]KAJ5098701.1 hypothetical protein N7532_005702 [Penicillium argentinense]